MKEQHEVRMGKIKSDNDYWTNLNSKIAESQKRSDKWWEKYKNEEHDWQKIDKKEVVLDKNIEKHKKGFINDIEMELVKENITNERLNKRLEVIDWREKIREAGDFDQALSMRSHLWDIIRKLKYEYICASCGEKNEKEYNLYCCSWECKDRLKSRKNQASKNDFGFSNISEFFAWMKKLGVEKIEFDFNVNKVVVICKNGEKISVSDKKSGLTAGQQESLNERFKSEKSAITFSQIQSSLKGEENKKNGNLGIVIAVILLLGILFTAIAIIYRKRKKEY